MLTRIEIHGFKNLLDLEVEFGPFTCIAGPNGVGKSNLFDAIHFLSLLADRPLMEAARSIRGSEGRGGDPRELFWSNGSDRSEPIRLTAEMVVPRAVLDDFGRSASATATFLRYELELGYEPPSGMENLGRIVLHEERLDYIKRGESRRHLRFHHSKDFRDAVVHSRRFGKAFISTEGDGPEKAIHVHMDGSGGRSHPSPAASAPRTVVSTTTTSADPTILAVRREMQSWRQLALEPTAMRGSDAFSASPHMAANGAHMAAALYRLASRPQEPGGSADPEAVYERLAARAAALIDVSGLRVDRDDHRELLTLELKEGRGEFLPARSLSDGTLRFLALCILEADPDVTGLICMEEPENGIHPGRMPAMVDLVRSLAFDPFESPGEHNPLRQVIVNTHSPPFVAEQRPDDLLMATEVTIRSPSGEPAKTLRLQPIKGAWRCDKPERGVNRAELNIYLMERKGQLALEFSESA